MTGEESSDYGQLMGLVYYDDIDGVKKMIRGGVDVNLCDDCGRTVLHEAAAQGNLQMVKLLVRAGAKLEALEGNATPLRSAVTSQSYKVVQYLIKIGARVGICDPQGRTLLHEAAEMEDQKMVAILLRAGLGINVVDINGDTPLDLTIEDGKAYRHLKIRGGRLSQ